MINVPKRIHYYGSMTDITMLEKGELYKNLKDSRIIMICCFDPFELGFYKYTFRYFCKEDKTQEMTDGTERIYLNVKGTAGNIDMGLKEFLNYVAGESSEDLFVKKIDEAVQMAKKNKYWRREYMILRMRDLEKLEEGREEGRREGCEEIILTMLKKNMAPEDISRMTDFPVERILAVRNRKLIH